MIVEVDSIVIGGKVGVLDGGGGVIVEVDSIVVGGDVGVLDGGGGVPPDI